MGEDVNLNHAGMPITRDLGTLRFWQQQLQLLSQCSNVYVKLSDLGMLDHAWQVDMMQELLLRCIDIFTPKRCLFASNFPVDSLFNSYQRWVGVFRSAIAGLSDDEQRAVCYQNAAKLYRLAWASILEYLKVTTHACY